MTLFKEIGESGFKDAYILNENLNLLVFSPTDSSTTAAAALFHFDWFSLVNLFICIVGILTNVVNMFVFVDKQLKDPSYKYMLLLAVNNATYLFILLFLVFIKCGTVCDATFSHLFITNLYLFIFIDYFTSCLAINGILIELVLSVQRLYLILSKNQKSALFWRAQFRSLKAMPIALFIFSLIFYSPVLGLKTIISFDLNQTDKSSNATTALEDGQQRQYALVSNQFGQSFYGKLITITLTSVRLFLATGVLFVINLITACKFNSYFKRKSNRFNIAKKPSRSGAAAAQQAETGGVAVSNTTPLTGLNNDMTSSQLSGNGSRKRKYTFSLSQRYNVTLMVIVRSFLYSIGTVPFSVYYILTIVYAKDALHTNHFMSIQAVLLTFVHIMYSFDFFIYYCFNRMYRCVVNRLFKRVLAGRFSDRR
jgi:hypothetical protein